MDDVQALVLAGGPDEGNPLTMTQSRAALRFAATYRLIDFPLANCINSKMKRIFVLTQFNSHSLNQHVVAAYPPEVFGFGEKGCVGAWGWRGFTHTRAFPPPPPCPPLVVFFRRGEGKRRWGCCCCCC
jgi:hypothetical protein